jgi:hypothetical protein
MTEKSVLSLKPMTLTAHELGAVNHSLRVGKDKDVMGNFVPYLFDKAEELDALSILKKLRASTKGEGKDAVFVDGEIELTTTEKTLILKALDRKYDLDALEVILPLREKLNAA